MEVAETFRNNPGLHSACPKTLVPHPHHKRPVLGGGGDAGEVTLLEVNDSPVAG